jgi:hypothetical protein
MRSLHLLLENIHTIEITQKSLAGSAKFNVSISQQSTQSGPLLERGLTNMKKLCTISGYHNSGYEGLYLLAYNVL